VGRERWAVQNTEEPRLMRAPGESKWQMRSFAPRQEPKAPEEKARNCQRFPSKIHGDSGQRKHEAQATQSRHGEQNRTSIVLNLEAMTTGVLAANSSVIMLSVAPMELRRLESAGNLRARPGKSRETATQVSTSEATRNWTEESLGFR
jgi:hypothetical protein